MDERLGEKDKEFIYTTLSYEYVFLLWKASSRQPGGDPSRCITWLPVPLEKVKVRGLVISFPVSPPGGSTSQRLFRHFLSTLPRFFFSPVFLPSFSSRPTMTGDTSRDSLEPATSAGKDKSFVSNRHPLRNVAIRIYSDYLLIREEGISFSLRKHR